MKSAPSREMRPRKAQRLILGPHSPEFSTHGLLQLQFTIVSGTWQSANDPVGVPFRLSEGLTIEQLGWVNGSAAGGNIDVGIYNSAWTRLVSTGSTAGSGNSLPQWVDITDTFVPPNVVHYLVIALNNVTANRLRYWNGGSGAGHLQIIELAGMKDSATNSFPLPDPLTGMGAPSFVTFVPHVLMAARSPF